MIRIIIIFIVFCIISASLKAQSSLEGQWPQGKNIPVYLLRDWGQSAQIIDSVKVGADGNFRFLHPPAEPGVYGFYIPGTKICDFIWYNENVRITVNGKTGEAHSAENDAWNSMRAKIGDIESVMADVQDEIYSTNVMSEAGQRKSDSLTKELGSLAYVRNLEISNFCKENPAFFFSKYLCALFRYPLQSDFPAESNLSEKEFFRKHWFDDLDLQHEYVLHAPYLADRIRSYFENFGNADIRDLKSGVQSLLERASVNEQVKNSLARILLYHFKEKGPDELFVWMAEEGIQGCESGLLDAPAKERAALLRKLQPGNPAPDFSLPGKDARIQSLSSFKGKNILLVFWQSSCEHCMNDLPALSAITRPYLAKGFDVVAVSLDNSAQNWNAGMMMMGIMNWTHLCDFKSWESPAVAAYGIRRTPGLFLISADGIILAKDPAQSELRSKLKSLYP